MKKEILFSISFLLYYYIGNEYKQYKTITYAQLFFNS